MLSWQQYSRCHFVSFVMYISGAKFEDDLGLSLRARGRGFSPATTSLSPGYFDTKQKYWNQKNASNYKIMN